MMKLYDVMNSRTIPGDDTTEWGNSSVATMSEFETAHATLPGDRVTKSSIAGLTDPAREGLSLLQAIGTNGDLNHLPTATRLIGSSWNGTALGFEKVQRDPTGSGTITRATLGLTSLPAFNTSTGVDVKTLPWLARLSTQWVTTTSQATNHHRTDLRVSAFGLTGETVYSFGPYASLVGSVTTDWSKLTGARVGARLGDAATGMLQGSLDFDPSGTGVTISGSHRLSDTLRVGGALKAIPTRDGEHVDPSVKLVYQPARGLKLSATADPSALTTKVDVAVSTGVAVSLFHRRNRDGPSSTGFGIGFGSGGVTGSPSALGKLLGLTV